LFTSGFDLEIDARVNILRIGRFVHVFQRVKLVASDVNQALSLQMARALE